MFQPWLATIPIGGGTWGASTTGDYGLVSKIPGCCYPSFTGDRIHQ